MLAVCEPARAGSAGDELFALAEQARRSGDSAGEFDRLADVLESDPTHAGAHARLEQLTGPAERVRLSSLDAELARALRHPYDPWALVRAGEALSRDGRNEEAVFLLEKAAWLTDLDPASGLEALHLLREIDPAWRQRRIVPVQVYADERIRAVEGWRFLMRTVWLSASNSLEGVLQTRFLPLSIDSLDTDGMPNDLDEVHASLVAGTPAPAEGLRALLTGRSVPDGPGVFKRGVAEFLGRSLVVRVEPGATHSRVLAHEILHLYGAIHVVEDVDSLMNPSGESLVLDAPSLAIVRALRRRGFASGGIEENVLPWVDLEEAIDAYTNALGVNLMFREENILEARREGQLSRVFAAVRAKRAMALDVHLADASRVVAILMLADQRRAEALMMLELASDLYGRRTPRGRETAQRADLLRSALQEKQ